MKKLREWTVLAGMVTCCAAMGAEAEIPKCDFAVEVSGATEAILAACELVTTAQDQGYGFLRAEPCMYGKHMRDEENTEVRCHFEKGQVIRVLASGCLLAEDIDLRVFRPDDWRIADDTKFHKAASVDFTTTVSGDFRLSMELARTSKSAFCLMVVMEQGGHQVATDDLSQLFVRYLVGNALIARSESQKGRSLTYARSSSTWSLLGNVLSTETTVKCWADRQPGACFVSLFADPKAIDVDLDVLDDKGNLVAEDRGPEPCAIAEFSSPTGGAYVQLISVPRATPATLGLMTLLDAK